LLLEQLSNEIGVSGDESLIRKIIIPAIKNHVDQVTVDTMGNVFAYKSQAEAAKTVMVTAHMDEVGFMITEIRGSGMLRFQPAGGFDPRILPGKTVLVGKNRIPGVIGLEAIHNLQGDQFSKAPTIKSLAIDIGAAKKEEATAKVSVGDYAAFDTNYEFLNSDPNEPTGGIVKGKALDNRVGCALLVEILKEAYPVNVVGVFTVQEEIGLRGASVAAHKVNPDVAIVLECTTADDIPVRDKEIGYPRLGDGPCLTVMDRAFFANRTLLDLVEATANKQNIPYQFKNPSMGGTDAGAIHLAQAGIPSIGISVPGRYIHSPVTLMDLADFWRSLELVKATLNEM
jgi:endoglucanase